MLLLLALLMNVEISLVWIDVDFLSWQGKDEYKTLIENIGWAKKKKQNNKDWDQHSKQFLKG